jgi:fructokinase
VDPLFDLSTVVKLSEDELSPLLGVEGPEEAAERLTGRGASLVLVSLGPKGAFYATRKFSGSVPAFEVEVVDATGAGDAFFAATLAHLSGDPEHLLDEEWVLEATLRGSAAGALACTDYGAMRALPTKDELERFMAGGG